MKRIFLFLALSLVLPSWAQVYTAKSGEISFHSEAPLENIDAVNNAANSVLNTDSREIAFLVPLRKFIFKKSLMQEHFNGKYMESDKFPNASFKGRINESVNFTSDGETKVTATGKLTIHGVEREVIVPGIVTVKNGEISVQSAFTVKVADYKITIPKLMFQNIAESIDVKVSINYTPYKK